MAQQSPGNLQGSTTQPGYAAPPRGLLLHGRDGRIGHDVRGTRAAGRRDVPRADQARQQPGSAGRLPADHLLVQRLRSARHGGTPGDRARCHQVGMGSPDWLTSVGTNQPGG